MKTLTLIVAALLACFVQTKAADEKTKLPTIYISGRARPDARVSFIVDIKAKEQNSYCITTVGWGAGTYTYPHFYSIDDNTNADYAGYYYSDVTLKKRMLRLIAEEIKLGKFKLPESMSVEDYYDLCRFEITQMSISSDDSNLYIRDNSNHSYFNRLYVPAGATKVKDYTFNRYGLSEIDFIIDFDR